MQIENHKEKKDSLIDKSTICKQVLNDMLECAFIFNPRKLFCICNLYYLTVENFFKKIMSLASQLQINVSS